MGALGGWPGRLRRAVRHRAVRCARAVYLLLARSPAAPLLRLAAVQRVRLGVTEMPAQRVLAVLDLLAAAGARAWVAGGWGVDALAGRQTRRHSDLDLVIGNEPAWQQEVARALARGGFRPGRGEFTAGLPMPWRYPWYHDDGPSVEVLPVDLGEPPFRGAAGEPGPFSFGVIGGRRVPCLSAPLQLVLHTGYPARRADSADLRLLRALLPRPEGTVTA
jgi:lincosamide nucleotidyltransferase A/C/D/E